MTHRLRRAALRTMLVAAGATAFYGAAASAVAQPATTLAESQETEGPEEPPVRGLALPEVLDLPPKGPRG